MDSASQRQRPQHPLANYQFSADEIRVLRECNTESFFQRSLPLGAALGVGTYFGVKNGFLQPNLKYGAVPKVVVAVVVGYFVGKFSYQQKCAEKLMRLPNSKLGEVLRQRKSDGVMSRLNPDQNLGVSLALAPFSSTASSGKEEQAHQYARSSALNLDVENRPTMSGLDDIYRPSLDSPSPYFETELPLETAKPGMTYEELRNRNREEYVKKQQSVYSRPLPPEAPVVIREQEISKPLVATDHGASISKGHKNKYGDTWTD